MVTKEEVMLECRKNNRVCPMPIKWDELYQMLRVKKRGPNDGLPVPMILAAWWGTPGFVKMDVLKVQIDFAAEHNALNEVYIFLQSLSESDWLHTTDSR